MLLRPAFLLERCMYTHVHTYVRTYIHSFVRTYVRIVYRDARTYIYIYMHMMAPDAVKACFSH